MMMATGAVMASFGSRIESKAPIGLARRWQGVRDGLSCLGEWRQAPTALFLRTDDNPVMTKKPAPGRKSATGGRVGAAASAEARKIRLLKRKLALAQAQIAGLQALAETDPLLDILNRRGFTRAFEKAIAYMRRYRASGALMVLDIDRLKPVNDAFGHAAGDMVLRAIVDVVKRHVRASDVFGRLGGDEFALLLWNVTGAAAQSKAFALEAAVDGLALRFDGHPIRTGISVGVVEIDPPADMLETLKRADHAMYARKTQRRTRPTLSPLAPT